MIARRLSTHKLDTRTIGTQSFHQNAASTGSSMATSRKFASSGNGKSVLSADRDRRGGGINGVTFTEVDRDTGGNAVATGLSGNIETTDCGANRDRHR